MTDQALASMFAGELEPVGSDNEVQPPNESAWVLIDPTTDRVISEHTNEHEAIREARSLLDEGKSVEIVQSGVNGFLTSNE